MKYLLDTNICIHFFRGKFNLIDKFSNIGFENFAISEITLAELMFGAENSSNPENNYILIEKFTDQITILPIFDCLLKYAKEKARLRKAGITISDFDLIIGCTSIVGEMIMVTENLKEFERIEGIQLENWIKRN
ncbi:MAG: type II toxin-antitoxin system VapC family toxin [Bacteroidales bacterium]|nr:type II toxin-antitoxin system VapC family toxin [Bacteroidales bacterium]MCF8389894.1 type II toxin-antitoxin system VapC family toxin [Bacteroidales bacterium]